MIILRDDQTKAVAELRASLKTNQSVLLHAECGFGKTVCASYMAHGAQQRNKCVILGVHRKELVRQTAKTFDRFGIRYGFISGGYGFDPFASVYIATAQTLANRRQHLKRCDLFIPDEAHLWGSGTRLEIIQEARAAGSHIVPLTATPARGDGVGLECMADDMVHGPSASWLIENGLLANYKAYAPVQPDLSGLHTRASEYITAELEDRFSKPSVTGDRVAAYKKYASGLRMIGYCYSRKNGEETAQAFRDAGVTAAFIDGETDDAERRKVINDFADGRIMVLLNVALFREGFDLAAQVGRDVTVQAVGLYAPTQSLPLAIQMMMRALRYWPGVSVLLDHVNLFSTHGLPDDEREWSLKSKERRKRGEGGETAVLSCMCASCLYTARGTFLTCPDCGATREIKGREVEHVEGELAEVDLNAVRNARKVEQAQARTMEALIAHGKAQGYRNPVGWARHVHAARGGR